MSFPPWVQGGNESFELSEAGGRIEQDKYTLDPGYKNLSKNSNKFSESYILV